ncbi:hypothetical protein Plhal304r1_c086g0169091 [Plasmopara halstedii]
MEVDTPSATELEEMKVEDSMTNAYIRSLMLIAGGSEDRTHAIIETQARFITITLPASTRFSIPWFSHPMVRLKLRSDNTHRYVILRLPLKTTNGSDHEVALPNDSLGDQLDIEADAVPESKRQRVDSYEINLAVNDLPYSLQESMATPVAAEWKEAIRNEIRPHVKNQILSRLAGEK